jgi:hypothetical protein
VTESGHYEGFTDEELAGEYEALRDEQRRLKREAARVASQSVLVEALLMRRLGDGEAVVSPHSGRVCFKAEGPLGNAGVNKAAIDEHHDFLPVELLPKTEVRYPGVTAIRQAAKDGRLPDGMRADDLLIPAPPGSVLRWRTLEGAVS